MALTDKNILITPNIGSSNEPSIKFTGADASNSGTITLRVLNSSATGILSFEGNSGQLFSIVDSLSGSIFSVNDISGIPSIEVFDTGEVRLAQYNGFVDILNSTIATSTNSGALQVVGGVGIGGDLYVGGTLNGVGSFKVSPIKADSVNKEFIVFYNPITKELTTATSASGVQGPAGFQGAQGHNGIQGTVGAQGQVGAQGPAGFQGPQGQVGAQGPAGFQGPQGQVGAQGPAGFQGAQGHNGIQGAQGNQGFSGPIATVATSVNANHYLTFVDSNNSPAAQETVYTNSNFYVNPSTGLFVTNSINLPQNPVGTTYGNGVSTSPPNMISQTVGDNDGWRLYGESAATNQVRMVFELVDDIEEAYTDQWVFRNKKTYTDYIARNEFQISGTGDALARSSLRAPIFYDSNDTTYYLDPASTTTSLQIAGTIEQGNNYAHPNVEWSATGTSTGEIIFYLPGTTSNYGMVHMVFDVYEYNGNATSTITLGGHNWNGSWYNVTCDVIGQFPHQVRLGSKDGRYVVVFGNSTTSWNYGTIRLRKIHNGSFYNNIMDLGGNWSAVQSTANSFSTITSDLRGLRTPVNFTAGNHVTAGGYVTGSRLWTGYDSGETGSVSANNWFRSGGNTGWYNASHAGGIYMEDSTWVRVYGNKQFLSANIIQSNTDVRAPIFYDSNDTNFYVDPTGTTVLNALTVNTVNFSGTISGNAGSADMLNSFDTRNTATTPESFNARIRYDFKGNSTNGLNDGGSYNGVMFWRKYSSGTDWSGGGAVELSYTDNARLWMRYGAGSSWGSWKRVVFGDAFDNGGTILTSGDIRAPIFYDSNDTTYYVDPASTSRLNIIRNTKIHDDGNTFVMRYGASSGATRHINLADSTGDPSQVVATGAGTGISWGQRNDDIPYYMIHLVRENIGGDYTKLVVAWHTGIRIGASSTYGGTRFFNDSPFTGSEIFSVGKGDNHVRVVNNLYAPIFYDSNNTEFYLDPNTTGTSLNMAGSVRAATHNRPGILSVASGTASTGASFAIQQETAEGWTGIFVDFEPYTGWGLYHDNPGNLFSFTSETDTGSIRSFTVPSRVSGNRTAHEKFRVDQNNGDIIVGRDGSAQSSFRAPIFYDSNDTNYYVDPNNTGIAVSTNGIVSSGVGTNGGFQNRAYTVGRNRIWSFGNSDAYGISYFQGSGGYLESDSIGVHFGTATAAGSTFIFRNNGSFITQSGINASIFYDVNDTTYYLDPASTTTSLNMAGSVRQANYNKPGILSVASGSASTGASFAIQQETSEGWTGIFVDYEPFTGWGLYHDNPANLFCFTSEAATGQIRSFTVPSRVSGNRTAYEKFRVDQNNGDIIVGRDGYAQTSFRAPIFYDSNDTNYYVDPTSITSLRTVGSWRSNSSDWDGEFAGKIQYHSNNWYLQASGSWFFRNAGGTNVAEITNSGEYQGASLLLSGNARTNNYRLVLRDDSIENHATDSDSAGIAVNYYGYSAGVSRFRNFTVFDGKGGSRLNVYGSDNYTQATGSLRAPIFYDSNDTNYYVDPAGVSNVNNLLMLSAVSNNNNGLRNVMPGGGTYITGISSITGAIVITLPESTYPMIRFTVKVYTYDGLSFDINCGGHTSGGTWYNTFAYMTTQSRSALNVRFTYGGGNVYVYIGELGTVWSYPQVFITDVQVGYSSYEYSRWDNGWTIGFNTSTYNNISATHTVYPPVSSTNNTNASYSSVYYDSNDTSYYVNPNGSSYLHTLLLSGASYFRPSNWIQFDSSYGLYWPNTNDAHVHGNNLSTYGSIAIRGVRNGWRGIHFYEGGNQPHLMFDGSSNGGIYFEGGGRWASYYNYSNNCWGFGESTTYSTWNAYGAKGFLAGTRIDSPIFYDSNDTSYYCDPNGTSRFSSHEVTSTLIHATKKTYYIGNLTASGTQARRFEIARLYIDYNDWHSAGVFQVELHNNYYHGGDYQLWNISYDYNNVSCNLISGDSPRGRHATVTCSSPVQISGDFYYISVYVDVRHYSQYYAWVNSSWPTATVHQAQGGNALVYQSPSPSNISDFTPSTTITTTNTIASTTGVQSPIYYDSNDTGYYFDGASTTRTNIIQTNYIGVNQAYDSSWRLIVNGNAYLNGGGYGQAEGSWRAPIFYDSNDTTYYVDPNSKSELKSLDLGYTSGQVYDTPGQGTLFFNNHGESDIQGYSIGTTLENVNGNYTKLTIDWHTGIKIGASSTYGGIRFYNNSIKHYGGSEVFSIAKGDNHVRVGEILYVGTDVRAPIFYDSNNTAYYWNGASTSKWNESNQDGWHTFNNYGLGVTGTYDSYRLQTIFAMGSAYRMAADGASTSNMYGLAWSHPNAGSLGGANNLNDHGLLIINNGSFRAAISSRAVFSADVRGTLFYDYNNTAYYVDPNSTSRLNTTETDQSYTYGWFRNYSNNTGLYNQNTTQHLSSTINGYWDMSSTTTVTGIRFYTGGHLSALRGYVYADTSNNIGFLNSGGNWRLRVVSDDYSLADGSSMRAQLFYDSNNTGYYVDPAASTSLRTVGDWRADNSSWTGDFAGKIQYHSNSWYLQASGSWIFRTAAGANVVEATNAGAIRAVNEITAYYSDERLKTFDGKIANALEKIIKLNGYYFYENDLAKSIGYNNPNRQVGVSAQEVEAVFPEVVTGAAINSNIENADYKTVRYEKMIPLLIEAIKEQQSQIDELKTAIKNLLDKH